MINNILIMITKNCFSLKGIIPMTVNVMLEFARNFTIVRSYGNE